MIERGSEAIGVRAPTMTRAQQSHRYTKYSEDVGAAIGISIGCLLGMFPLLFIDSKKAQFLKQQEELDLLFNSVFEEVSELLHAETASLWLIDQVRTGSETEPEGGEVRNTQRGNDEADHDEWVAG